MQETTTNARQAKAARIAELEALGRKDQESAAESKRKILALVAHEKRDYVEQLIEEHLTLRLSAGGALASAASMRGRHD